MKTALLALGLCILSGVHARADLSVKQYQATMRSNNEAAILNITTYLNGIASGIMAATSIAFNKEGVRLYCPPSNLVVNADNYFDILNRAIKSFVGMPDLEDAPIALVLMRGLASTFPCPAK
jgi:hypothetical protein